MAVKIFSWKKRNQEIELLSIRRIEKELAMNIQLIYCESVKP